MSLELKEIAEKCKSIIENPEENLIQLKEIIKSINKGDEETNKILFIAVLKVFRAVIPLYKVRTLKDKIIHKTDNLEITGFDKLILETYRTFITKILENNSSVSFRCAVEILNNFDHFNYIDKIVNKTLLGTLKGTSIRTLCCEALQNKFLEDIKGDITFIIINQMFENDFNPIILSYLTEITFLKDFLVEGEPEETKKPKDKFFKWERSGDKKKRKIEKQRRIAENLAREEQEKEEKRMVFVVHRKIVDALQRLYFLILKDKLKNKLKFTFIGIAKYKKFIRNEFLEGLYVLLNDAIAVGDLESKLYGIITTLEIYSQFRYDFKRLVEALYCVVDPFNYQLTSNNINLIDKTIDELFIRCKQPIQRVYALIHRLILLYCVRYVPLLKKIINTLCSVYEIELLEVFKYKEKQSEDIDSFVNMPFYENCLFKKLI